MDWLRTHEPVLARHLTGREPLDFKAMRRYSHSSRQVFSGQRWACVGEAGVFADPYYSPGTDLIGFANTMTVDLIRRDREGGSDPDRLKHYNQFLIALNDSVTSSIQRGYPMFGNPAVTAVKCLWDVSAAWSFNCPLMFNDIYLDPAKHNGIRKITAGFGAMAGRVGRLLEEWTKSSTGRLNYRFFDYLSLDFLAELRERNLQSGKTVEVLQRDARDNMARVEELAQVIFLLAVEDLMPERLAELGPLPWLNAWRLDLDPSTWEQGLLRPTTPPRDLRPLRAAIRGQMTTAEPLAA
jgi:hypothetical protein